MHENVDMTVMLDLTNNSPCRLIITSLLFPKMLAMILKGIALCTLE